MQMDIRRKNNLQKSSYYFERLSGKCIAIIQCHFHSRLQMSTLHLLQAFIYYLDVFIYSL